MRVSIWIKKKNIKTQTSYHQISEKMGAVLNPGNISDQKFQSKIKTIFSIPKLNFYFRTDDKPKSDHKEKRPGRSGSKVGLKPQKVKDEKVKDEVEKNDKEETYCFCSQVSL